MEFVTNLDKERYQKFMESSEKSHFLQSTHWGLFKSKTSWDYDLVGVVENNQLIASALVLKRKVIANRNLIYIPRGFVLDYNNHELFEFFTENMKKYAKQNNAMFFRVDPDIENNDLNMNLFTRSGYKHNGFNLNFEKTQPRFTFRLDLRNLCQDTIIDVFDPKRKAAIKVALKNEIQVYQATDNGEKFYDLMKQTALRQGFAIHSKKYFDDLFETYTNSGKLKIMYASINFQKANQKLLLTKKEIESQVTQLNEKALTKKTLNKINEFNSQLKRIEKLINENIENEHNFGCELVIASAVIIYEGNKAWYVYGASDEQFNHLCAVDLMQLQCIQEAKNRNVEFYDFFGTTGDPSPENPLHGIYQFKKKYGGTMYEFIGEFDYVLKPISYRLFDNLYPKILAFLVKRKSKKRS